MPAETFIESAIDAGTRGGVASLDPDQRLVYLISEAEVLCDMEGIDTFLRRYWTDWGQECVAAFEAVGASEIAAGLRALGDGTAGDEALRERVNALITGRAGYGYEAIRRVIESRLTQRTEGQCHPPNA
jgi:hypothetical protein